MVKVISLPYIFQVLYVLCFTRISDERLQDHWSSGLEHLGNFLQCGNCQSVLIRQKMLTKRNDPKISDRGLGKQCRPRSDCSSLIRVFTVCYSICMFLTKYLQV